MRKILTAVLSVALTLSIAGGCSSKGGIGAPSDTENNSGLKIVTTIFPPYDFARAITGNTDDIKLLIQPGGEVHSFDPSPQDIIAIRQADVFIYVGGESDTWVNTILESMDTTEKKLVRLIDYVNAVEEEYIKGMQVDEHEHEDEDEHELDEHIWTSPKNAAALVGAIVDALCEKDAPNAERYRANADGYIKQINEIDAEIAEIVKNGKRDKIIVADKFPFRYFTDEFGLEYAAAFPGCSTESDCSAATLAYLIDTVKSEQIPYVYYVELSNQKIADAMKEQTGADTLLLHSCHNLSKTEFTAGETYVSLMRQNAENLKKGLN